MGLVLRVQLVPERLAGQVERTEQIVGPLGIEQIEQVAGEAVDGPDGLAGRTGHLRQGVEDLVDQRMGVDDVHLLARQRLWRGDGGHRTQAAGGRLLLHRTGRFDGRRFGDVKEERPLRVAPRHARSYPLASGAIPNPRRGWFIRPDRR